MKTCIDATGEFLAELGQEEGCLAVCTGRTGMTNVNNLQVSAYSDWPG